MGNTAKKETDFFFFETSKLDSRNYRSFYFYDPVEKIELRDPSAAGEFFRHLETLAKKYFVAGFFSYEFGYVLEEKFLCKKSQKFPLALFFAYDDVVVRDYRKKDYQPKFFDAAARYALTNLKLDISRKEYFEKIEKIKRHLIAGDIYQANFTTKYKFGFEGSPYAFYLDLRRKQKVPYNVFARFGNNWILSFSPELFFRKRGRKIVVKPMKGTCPRGRTNEEDSKNRRFLKYDEKNRAENLMIVDEIRNDLGRISEFSTVKTRKLFEVEKYETLFQMTSEISAVLKKDVSLFNLIKSIFPSGSVTGAPKIRSMEIIRELEKEERKIYTGSVGFFYPGGLAEFNVAIRTILIEGTRGEMGVGGGIVIDSSAPSEFEECLLKGRFLTEPAKKFSLIETILYKSGFENLSSHLERLQSSAGYFGIPFRKNEISKVLKNSVKNAGGGKYKVRLLVDASGSASATCGRVDEICDNPKIKLSAQTAESSNPFIFHKTTNRNLYDEELKKARKSGFFDVVFSNEKGEITEGAITNVYVRKDGILYTPPVSCGLLDGTIRRNLLKSGKAKEKIITRDEFLSAREIYISNSIIGIKKARNISRRK